MNGIVNENYTGNILQRGVVYKLRNCCSLHWLVSYDNGAYETIVDRDQIDIVPDLVASAVLPTSSSDRKNIPLCTGVLDYFPAALAEVAKVSKAGNDKHNPGEPLHHARGKSMDHADCIARHLSERGTIDPSDGLSHTAHLAWRALALLQEELEARGASLARGAKLP